MITEDGDVSDDDEVEDRDDDAWFGMGMLRGEKLEAQRPWRNSVIIKLIGRSIKYHFLWRRCTQDEPLLTDLGFDFFMVKLGRREEYERALMEGPWMIWDNYLHVQR